MSTSHSQETRPDQAGKRRKRKERAATRAPEPKNIVSGAGQPLDLSVRRELEERLGHDFGRVRLHTDRDAGALTEMLGADAVAVGQDIFFREGAYRPGTPDGQRLLAHELLHTVQNPHGLGALRAGRDLGEVSLPQQAMEREAESAAQESVRDGEAGTQVEEGQSTPGWLRYATVDADRNRLEQIDPATLVERLANSVVRSLRGDPEDRSKRTRRQLARLPEELQDTVLERLETRLLSSEHERLLDLVDEVEAYDDLERSSLDAPAAESDPVGELRYERETAQRSAEEQREEERQPAPAPGPEKDQEDEGGAPGSTPENGSSRGSGEQGQRQGQGQGRDPGAASAAPAAAPRQQASSASSGSASSSPSGGGAETAGSGEGKEGQEQQGAPAASREESAARNRPGAVDALVAGQQLKPEDKGGSEKPTGSPSAAGKDAQLSGAFGTLDGVRAQDLDGPEEKSDDIPFGTGSASEVEVGGGEPSAWDVTLRPEDFLPTQDLDVSAVPTADTPDSYPSATPSFPAPPVTRADRVQAERDAEDAEDAAAEFEPEPEQDGAVALPATVPSAEADEGTQGDSLLGGIALEQATEVRPVTGSRDPKSGADPKAGPVAAQMAVEEAPGTSEAGSDAKEAADKEEKGTPAGGGAAAAQEKASPQAVAGNATAPEPAVKEEQKKADAAPTGRSGPAADSRAPSPARDTHVSGGSAVDTSGGAPSASTGSGPAKSGPVSRTESPAPETPVPTAAPEATKTQDTPTAAKTAPAPRAAASKPAPAPGGSGGGAGGGGGAKAAGPGRGKSSGAAPNLSGVAPEAGLSTASKLKPHKALQAMTGVSGSVDRTVGDEHKALAAAPPSMLRPAGAPQTLEGRPKADAPARYAQDPAARSEAPKGEKAEVEGAREPEGQIEAEKAEEPGGWDTFKMALGFGLAKVANFFGADIDESELAAKFAGLPTRDEALRKAQAGNAPGVEMEGAAERTAGEQGAAVDTKGRETVAAGRDDAARPMGENQVYPNAPKKQMTAKVPGGQGGGGGAPDGGAGTGAVPPEAASEVAEHERGPQFRAAFSDGRKGMSEGRQTRDADFRDSQQKHRAKVDAEIATNTRSQAGARDKALDEVTAERADWRTEQDAELKTLGTKKTERHEKVRTDVKDKEKKTDEDVVKEKADGDKKIQDENTKAEKDAEKKRDDSVEESGDWVSKAFDWIKKKVIEIKDAIVRVIKAARDAVVGVIKNFKETVERWINEARTFIADAIKNLINDLIEFAKSMVRAVVELANRIRKTITGLIAAAIAFVNRLATALKQAVRDLLDDIGKLLSSILDLLKKMLRDVVKAVVDAIRSVLDFAAALLAALGDFMLIAVDFLSDPGGWLGGAKNSAVDGAKNHLFREVRAAVKQWFQSKIEEIIGIPRAVIEKLIKGGFTLEKIIKETWDAIVPQLPFIIGEIVITKVIAKLIPGAGWAMAVIDAIRVAIGALGEILRAIGAVISWLKAVRQGGAGILFAKAVAAGIVALLEMAFEALLSGIGKYVAKVGRRLKGVAASLGKGQGKGKNKDGGGSDDEGGDKKAREQVPKRDTSPPGNRPTTTASPRPGAKPDLTGPGKPRTTPGKDRDDARPATRPTPSPKPEPKPEPPAEPKTEPDTKPGPKDGTPGRRPGDDKDSTKRVADDKNGPDKPKDQDPVRPRTKPDDKNTAGRPGPDRDNGGKKPEPEDGKKDPKPRSDKDKDKEKGKGGRNPGKDGSRTGPGRPKSRTERDRRRDEEDDSKADRLRAIVARIRPVIEAKLESGISQPSHRAMLEGLRAHYRLTSLGKSHDQDFEVRARLNPSMPVTGGHTSSEDRNDYLRRQNAVEPPLPPTKLPPFKDGPERAPSLKAHHIKPTTPAGSEAKDRLNALPKGWDAVSPKYSRGGAWVRMHLLPAPLGGEATTSNLVPARGDQNKDAATSVEHPAAKSLGNVVRNSKWKGKINKMIWYDVNVSYFGDGTFPGFPNSVSVTWGGYGHPHGHWQRDPAAGIWSRGFQPPPHKEDLPSPVADVNQDDAHVIRRATGVSLYFAKRISDLTQPNRGRGKTFANMRALSRALNVGDHLRPGESDETHTGGSHRNRLEALVLLRRAARKKRLTF
ncbi:eCIS core domain-containing protein [Streptomyces clavifer]|uniref:eCIS core domain-containing protein n=1 Tax=Streptomyces clavifer TaxID=68188 RepID=UPI003428C0DF